MNKYLIIFTFVLLCFCFPVQSFAQDINGKYEFGKDFIIDPSYFLDDNAVFDGDEDTFSIMNSGLGMIRFIKPVFLKSVSYKVSNEVNFSYIDNTGKVLLNNSVQKTTGISTMSIDTKGYLVSGIRLNKTSGNRINVYEVGFYGDIPFVHDSISNLKSKVIGNNISFTFGVPTNEEFVSTKVYRNGKLIDTLDSKETNFTDDNLEYETSYSYEFIAFYSDGGQANSVKSIVYTEQKPLDPSKIPPSSVLNLKGVNIKDISADLIWDLPADTDLDKVKIYKSGVLIDTISISVSYGLTSLKPSTSYNYQVSLFDKDGNEGAKSDIYFKTLDFVDLDPPAIPTIVRVSSGDTFLDLLWNYNLEPDVLGYNVYLDGIKVNKNLLGTNKFKFDGLENGRVYKIEVEAVDSSKNVSLKALATGSPKEGLIPKVNTAFIDLKNVADNISNWFGGLWLIIAFAVAIPLALMIATRVKGLFIR